MILVPTKKVEKIKYFSTLLGLIFIEITRGPFCQQLRTKPNIFKKHRPLFTDSFLRSSRNYEINLNMTS